MTRMMKAAPVLLMVLLVSACSQFHVPPYSVHHKNVIELRNLSEGTDATMGVGHVRGVNQGAREITCRAVGPIQPASTGTFGQYIENALIAEMSIANVYLENSDVQVDLDFSNFDFSSASGSWTMAADVAVRGSTFPVKVTHNFSPSWFGETACDQTAQALMPAVQEFVYQVVSNPQFKAAVTGKAAAVDAK